MVHSVATIVVTWGVSTTRIIPTIIVVRIVVIVMITRWVHGPSGLVKLRGSWLRGIVQVPRKWGSSSSSGGACLECHDDNLGVPI